MRQREHPHGLTRGLCELALESSDPPALADFYAELFDWEVLSRDADQIWLGCGGRSRIGIWSPGRKEFGDQGGRHVHFALAAEPGRLEEIRARLERLGVQAEGPVEHDGGDRSLYFRDLEGNLVEAWDFFERSRGAEDGVDALR